ncbi:MAG: hypothetical protein KDK70_29615, partial [Myxococcales bacterium]|nr:hypothetical protein [Myxococcales bacterium]
VLGCGNRGGSDDTSTSANDGSSDTSAGTFGTMVVDPTTDGSGSADETGPPPGPGGECILEENDCTDPALKCMPWSEDPDQIPDSARCCPLQENPDLEGERCTVAQYDGSCLDSCEAGTMCLVDAHDSLEGVCRAFCDPASPTCDQGQGTCKSFFELLPGAFTVPLCMDQCDPLLQDCSPPSWHCIPDVPTLSGQSDFICVPPPPDEPLGAGDTCALANQCEQGLVCVPGSRLPDCAGTACCTNYCSLSEGDAPCMAIDPQLVCVDWQAPSPMLSDVGVCALPA